MNDGQPLGGREVHGGAVAVLPARREDERVARRVKRRAVDRAAERELGDACDEGAGGVGGDGPPQQQRKYQR